MMADKDRNLGQQGKAMPGQDPQQERSDQESGRPVQLDEKNTPPPGQGGQQPAAPRPVQPEQPTGQPKR
jgi:hypothetical protein